MKEIFKVNISRHLMQVGGFLFAVFWCRQKWLWTTHEIRWDLLKPFFTRE